MKKILIPTVGAALLAFAVVAAHSDGPGHPGHSGHMRMMHGGGGHFIASELNLTDEQKAEAKKLHEETFQRAEPLFEQHRAQMDQIYDLLDGANPNPTDIGQRMIAAHAIHKQVKALHDDAMARFSTLLTPEQLEKFNKIKEEHGERGERGERFFMHRHH
jgi:Spy/CpxP family protein refolding chaperone